MNRDRWEHPGERLQTEVSCKFNRSQVNEEFEDAGIRLDRRLSDEGQRYAFAVANKLGRLCWQPPRT